MENETSIKHPQYCRKEAEIAEMHADIKTVKGVVMGNERPGLIETVPLLNSNVAQLTKTIADLTTGVSGLLKFQEQEQGRVKGKNEMRTRNRWIIGILVTLSTALVGTIIYLVDMVMNHIPS